MIWFPRAGTGLQVVTQSLVRFRAVNRSSREMATMSSRPGLDVQDIQVR